MIGLVRMNNGTHQDISCYAKDMTSPVYLNTIQLDKEENAPVMIHCDAYENSNLTVCFASNGESFGSGIIQGRSVYTQVLNATRKSKLRILVNNDGSSSTIGGLKCNISVTNAPNNTMYYTNTSALFWSIVSSSNNNTDIVPRNKSHADTSTEAIWIWNDNENENASNHSYVMFEFDFYKVFLQ
eukprot:9436_1